MNENILFNTLGDGGVRVPQEMIERIRTGSNDLKSRILDRVKKVKSEKVKKYVHEALMHKIDQAGDGAGFWLERVEAEFETLKPKGWMEGFKDEDFDELWFVITGEKRRKSADRLLSKGQEKKEIDPSHNYRLGRRYGRQVL